MIELIIAVINKGGKWHGLCENDVGVNTDHQLSRATTNQDAYLCLLAEIINELELIAQGASQFKIYTNNLNLVKQWRGELKVKNPVHKELFAECKMSCQNIDVELEYIKI